MREWQYHSRGKGVGRQARQWIKRERMLTSLIAFLVGIMLLGSYQVSVGQSTSPPVFSSPAIDTIITQPATSASQNRLTQALEASKQGLQKAREQKLPIEEGKLLHQIGIIYKKLGDPEESLKNLLWAIMAFERAQATDKVIEVKRDLGDHYDQSRAYQKAIQYYQAYLKGKERLEEKIPDATYILEKIARGYFLLREYGQAEGTYHQLVVLYEESGDMASALAVYEALADINKEVGNIPMAIQHLQQVALLCRQQNDTLKLLGTLNNLGFLQKRNENLRLSIEHFQQALNLPEIYFKDPEMRVSMLTNMGVSYTNLGFFSRARESYLEALQLRQASGDVVGQASLYNYLASNAYVSRNNAQALIHANQAVELAIGRNAYQELATSYKLIALIYTEEQNAERARVYHQSYLEIQARLQAQQEQEHRNFIAIQERAETQEEYLKAAIIEEEQLALDRERQGNALKLKEQEVNLLRKNQALQEAELLNQQLEKERTEQQLAIARQELLAEKQKRELSELEQLKELQDLELEQQTLEREQQAKTIALLEAEKQLQKQKLQQEAQLRQYGYGILALFMVIIGVVSYSFFQKRKDNQKLQTQQQMIQEQNEHLRASEQMLMSSIQELEATQEALQKQKRQLEIEHHKTQESLQYAKRIQFSILPSEKESQAIFPESFVVFQPKDVVSGDFYWMSDHGNRRIASVVDCTGHGVPGALVSLIVYDMLDEAINEKGFLNPASILNYLNQQVHRRLREGDHSIQDGMDMGICLLETTPDQRVRLRYAGAKHTLYAVRDGTLLTLKGERKTVGSIHQKVEEHFLDLMPGDALYLTTDGYIDQSNPERQRFGSRRLKTLIQDWYTLPIAEQHTKFIEALEAHQQSSEQRDDINLIGIKI